MSDFIRREDAISAINAAREAVIRSGDKMFIVGVSTGHDRAEKAVLSMPAASDPRDEVIRRLMALLIEARGDLTAYVDAEYPPSLCLQYPDIAKRHHRDMGLCRQIDAALTFAKEQLK